MQETSITLSTPEPRIQGSVVGVAIDADGPLIGILLLGAAAIGKSSLALALIHHCPYQRTRLVADDMVCLKSHNAKIFASAPSCIRNKIEIRGYGLATEMMVREVSLRVVVLLQKERVPRLPEPQQWPSEGAEFPFQDTLKLPLLTCEMGPFSFSDHAFRLRGMIRSVLTGQTPPAQFL